LAEERIGIRTHLNATVQWTVARCGLDRSDTMIKSNPSSRHAAAIRKDGLFSFRLKIYTIVV
jgi:hypothetical protein